MNRSNYGSFKMQRRDSKMKSPLLLTKKEMGNRKFSKHHNNVLTNAEKVRMRSQGGGSTASNDHYLVKEFHQSEHKELNNDIS